MVLQYGDHVPKSTQKEFLYYKKGWLGVLQDWNKLTHVGEALSG
jgi:hypothetical protein